MAQEIKITDPDYLAGRPPTQALDPKTYFSIGAHEGRWIDYDDRGVPTKSVKNKKPRKKEKDAMEQEYLETSKTYQKWLKDVAEWEKTVADAEANLRKTDRLRWAFRQIGDKHEPIGPDDVEELFNFMSWKLIPEKELDIVKKGLEAIGDVDGLVSLQDLRKFTAETMPILLMEERLAINSRFDSIQVEDIYSPRTWRRKLEENPVNAARRSARSSTEKRSSIEKEEETRNSNRKRSHGRKMSGNSAHRHNSRRKTSSRGKSKSPSKVEADSPENSDKSPPGSARS